MMKKRCWICFAEIFFMKVDEEDDEEVE